MHKSDTIGAVTPGEVRLALPWPDKKLSPNARVQQQRAPTSAPIAISAKDEIERVSDITFASIRRRARPSSRDLHRTSGDRAHKRLKHRRAAGRG